MFRTARLPHLLTHTPQAFLLLASMFLLALAVAWGSTARAHEPVSAVERATAYVAGGEKRPTKKVANRRLASTQKAAKTKSAAKVKRIARKPVQRVAKPRPRPAQPARPVVSRPSEPAPPNDPLWRESWALARANTPSAWRLTTGRTETVVAVLDTGVDLGHPDLQGSFVAGFDVVNQDADPSDDHGHGTMVAGVIAARSDNGVGVTSTCWRCSVMPVKVIGADGSGNAGAVAQGIVWAADHGAHVINMSFVMSAPDDGVAAAIAHARSRGVVVVAAAGNSGTADATFPAAYPGVLSVAGSDAADARYGWSSYGSWVRFAAPGCSLTTAPGGGYGEFCGTSSATAFLSGIVGLARSLSPGISTDAIEGAVSAGAVPVGDFVSAGRIDAAAVLTALGPTTPTEAAPAETDGTGSAPAARSARTLELP